MAMNMNANDLGIRMGPPEGSRRKGAMLLELMIAMTVLALGLLGFIYSFQKNFSLSRDMTERDLAVAALANAVEQLVNSDFAKLYASYNNTQITPASKIGSPGSDTVTIGSLVDGSGNPARVLVN